MKVFLSCLLLLPLSAFADTIHVDKVYLQGALVLQTPYQTDKTNMKGTTFDMEEVLSKNSTLIDLPTGDKTIRRATALPAIDNKPTLRALRFTLRTQDFLRPTIIAKNLSKYKMYLNGKEISAGQPFSLRPGESNVDILSLTKPEEKDSFNISLAGKDLNLLQINATGKRLYVRDDMILGPHPNYLSISPNGRYLAYSIVTVKKDGTSVYETFIKDVKSQKVLNRYNAYTDVRWLPKADIMYGTREETGGRVLYTFDPATQQESVLASGIPTGSFEISPQRDYLVYRVEEDGQSYENGIKRIFQPDDRMPGWRKRQSLFRYDLKTGTMARLTFGKESVGLEDISSDGRRLLLLYDRFEATQRPFNRKVILTLDLSTNKVDTIYNNATFVESCSFSPDDKQILIKASPAAFDGIGSEVKPDQFPNSFDYRLYLLDLATKQVRPILKNFKPSVNRVNWATGDKNIYFSADDGFDISYFKLNPQTEKVIKFSLPVTCLGSCGLSYNEAQPRLFFTGQTDHSAREMFLASLKDAKPAATRIGNIDFAKMMKDVALPACKDWSFKTERGDTIKGFYYVPANFDPNKKYPMIVYYYGGCTPTTKQLEYVYPVADFANQGYVAYVVEPSGAIGFGQEFAARHVNTWGDESSDDIIQGVKAFLKAHPFVDKSRIGCIGASYGGFMTQYLQTKTDIFACGISHAGISDIGAYWGGGYWGYSYGETAEYGSFPWNNPDLFVKHSPLYNADKIHTPLLLLHGTVDTNVPTDQSQAIFTALKILGRPTAYVAVEDQNHYIGDFTKRKAWQEIINAWFAMWLKQKPLWWNTLYPGDEFDKTNTTK